MKFIYILHFHVLQLLIPITFLSYYINIFQKNIIHSVFTENNLLFISEQKCYRYICIGKFSSHDQKKFLLTLTASCLHIESIGSRKNI